MRSLRSTYGLIVILGEDWIISLDIFKLSTFTTSSNVKDNISDVRSRENLCSSGKPVSSMYMLTGIALVGGTATTLSPTISCTPSSVMER